MYELATLTLAHEEHLDDVVAGHGGGIKIDVIRAYWSLPSLMEIRRLVEHGYSAAATFPQVAVLNSLLGSASIRADVTHVRRPIPTVRSADRNDGSAHAPVATGCPERAVETSWALPPKCRSGTRKI